MNGFILLNQNTLKEYVATLDDSVAYEDGDYQCIDIECGDTDFGLNFLNKMAVPSKEDIASLLKDLLKLDEFIASRERSRIDYEETGNEHHFSYAEIENNDEIIMYYCGVNVNAQWGAKFNRANSGEWVFGGLC